MLEALYTDSYRDSSIGKLSMIISKLGLGNIVTDRLQNRKPNIPKEKIFANDRWQWRIILDRFSSSGRLSNLECVYQGGAREMISHGVGMANWLYAMFIENLEFTKYAKSKGLRVLTDIYENPYIFADLANEVATISEYSELQYLKAGFEAESALRMKYIDELLSTADKYLVPSAYVRNSLRRSPNFDESKVNIVPYKSSIKSTEYQNEPIKGRLIWIGNEPIRKGFAYAYRAFKKLKEHYPEVSLRVIGPMPERLVTDSRFSDVIFTGYLNKEQLAQEFRKADIYLFPTLAEGFAGSLLEAAGFGVPIVTTHASGFADDFPGVFVPVKDEDAIAEAVARLLDDRSARDAMSKAVFDYAKTFQSDRFEKDLIKILTDE